MDNLTHTMIGIGMARSGLSERFGRGTTMVLAVASNLPDLDVFLPFFTGIPAFAVRRMVTHSVLMFPLLALAAAFVFRLIYKEHSFKVLFGLCLLAMGVHVFLDLVNSYGVVAFWPLTRRRFELAWVFIIDLLIWFLMLIPIIAARLLRGSVEPRSLFRGFMLALACYIGFCGLSRFRCGRIARSWADTHDIRPSFTYLFPEALGAHRFRSVMRENDSYRVMLVNSLTGEAELVETVLTEENDPGAQTCRETQDAKKLLWFFKAPVWQKNQKTGHWRVFDLRFQSAVIGRRNLFVYELKDC